HALDLARALDAEGHLDAAGLERRVAERVGDAALDARLRRLEHAVEIVLRELARVGLGEIELLRAAERVALRHHLLVAGLELDLGRLRRIAVVAAAVARLLRQRRGARRLDGGEAAVLGAARALPPP